MIAVSAFWALWGRKKGASFKAAAGSLCTHSNSRSRQVTGPKAWELRKQCLRSADSKSQGLITFLL